MRLKNVLRGQAALEYILLASVAIMALLGTANFVFNVKKTNNGFNTHFESMSANIAPGAIAITF